MMIAVLIKGTVADARQAFRFSAAPVAGSTSVRGIWAVMASCATMRAMDDSEPSGA